VALVEHIAADAIGFVIINGFHDVGCVFIAAGMTQFRLGEDLAAQFFPFCDLVDASSGIFIQGDVEPLDQLGIFALDVEAVVLCIMFAGFSTVIAEIIDIIVADHIMMLFGGIHGAEFEGIVVLLNLIQILETGKDFRGEENKEIYDLAEQFHLIIIPSINPDGRARFPYKSVWGMPIKTFRYFAQGTWKDGSLCMHPACKQIHPIKEASGFLGCYFNDDGYNIQQDILPVITREGRFLHEVAHEFAPDVIMNLHGCCDSEGFLCGGGSAPQKIRNEITQFESKLGQELAKQGCMFLLTPKTPVGDKVNFPMGIQNALHLSCGAISLLYESNQGVDYERDEYLPGTQMLSYEGIYNAHFTMFRELMLFTKRTFETRRDAVKEAREKK